MSGWTIGSLFSGIGGLELGLERAGLGPVLWQAESDPDRRAWLSDHWPGARIYEDVRQVTEEAESVDVVCGGFPCQDLSAANRAGRGLEGDRSGLWREFARVVGVLRPRWVVVENVHHRWRRWVPVVRGDLWRLGYAGVPLRVRADQVGALHERARVFLVADCDGVILRQQPGRRGWQDRLEAALAAVAGAGRGAADAARERGEGRVAGKERAGKSGLGGDVPRRSTPNADQARLQERQGGRADPAGRRAAEREAAERVVGDGRAADADCPGQLQSGGADRQERRRSGDCVVEAHGLSRAAEPALVCPVHGVPGGLAGRPSRERSRRIAALGDAVVPQCAEVVGRLIRSLVGS